MQPDDAFRCPTCGQWCYTPSLAADHCNNAAVYQTSR